MQETYDYRPEKYNREWLALAPEGVDLNDWRRALDVYETVSKFLEPPWNKSARNYRRYDFDQQIYDKLRIWLQEISDPSKHIAEYVEQTSKIESLLRKAKADAHRNYDKHKEIVFNYIDINDSVDSYSLLPPFRKEALIEILQHMFYDNLIKWGDAEKGFIRK